MLETENYKIGKKWSYIIFGLFTHRNCQEIVDWSEKFYIFS